MSIALRTQGLRVSYPGVPNPKVVLDDISIQIQRGEILGVVGRSGSGKSILVRSLINLLPGEGEITDGQVEILGRDYLGLSEDDARSMRGNQIGVIVQNPRGHLHPMLRIGRQISNVYRAHRGGSKKEAEARALEVLKEVGIPAPVERMSAYPHELSGGMAQRVLIAMALTCEPDLMLADEPTSGLDVTIQDQILGLLRRSVQERGVAGLLVSRDMGIIANFCDRVAVMEGGRIVESASVPEFFDQAEHPASKSLIASATYGSAAVASTETILEQSS
ncbi:MAG: ABC transporter ATP-binding protein [Actinomycetota bacterium]|nr:ABC transporter ATP-binding protein [Actinomycetota bacterium]